MEAEIVTLGLNRLNGLCIIYSGNTYKEIQLHINLTERGGGKC